MEDYRSYVVKLHKKELLPSEMSISNKLAQFVSRDIDQDVKHKIWCLKWTLRSKYYTTHACQKLRIS